MTTTVVNKKFWEGTNFWVAFSLLVAGVWSGYTTDTGDAITTFIMGIPSATFAVRKLVKTKIDLISWIGDKNTWNYLATIITIVFGAQFAEAVPLIQDIVDAIGARNFQGIIGAIFSLGTMIYFWVRDNDNSQLAAQKN